MNLLESITNQILHDDIVEVINYDLLENIETNSTILVTGATGLIGSQIIKTLACWNEQKNKQLKILALARNIKKAHSIFEDWLDKNCIDIHIADINEPLKIDNAIDYIIHGANATSSRFFIENPVETIYTTLNGTKNILELAKEKQTKKVVYLSSLEIYGIPYSNNEYINETDYGYIDPTQVRSSYSEGKRMAECICVSYAKEYGVPVTIARLSQTFGANVNYNDGRVFAEFARCAVEGKDIILHTQGNTIRTYCYITDALKAIFTLMLFGEAGEAYNITNMNTAVSIKEMAELVCTLVPEKQIHVFIDIPENIAEFGYNPEMVIRLDSTKLQKLGWKPLIELNDMFERLIKGMKLQYTRIKDVRNDETITKNN